MSELGQERDLSHLETGDPAREATIALIRRINAIRRRRGWKTLKPAESNVAVQRFDDAFRNGVSVGEAVEAVERLADRYGPTSEPPGYHFHHYWIAARIEELPESLPEGFG